MKTNVLKFLAVGLLIVFMAVPASAQLEEAPADVVAALTLKIASFEKSISTAGDVVIYVYDNEDIAKELKKAIGKAIGSSTLSRVDSGTDDPPVKPHIVIVGAFGAKAKALNFCRINKSLSVSGIPNMVQQGVTLGIGIGPDKKPKIMLNLNASVEEEKDWNPAIMKVAQTIK